LVGFAAEGSDDWKWYLAHEVSTEMLRNLSPQSSVKYFFTSPEQEKQLRLLLQELGQGKTQFINRETVQPNLNLTARVTYLFDELGEGQRHPSAP
jgi:hypothetical protein